MFTIKSNVFLSTNLIVIISTIIHYLQKVKINKIQNVTKNNVSGSKNVRCFDM